MLLVLRVLLLRPGSHVSSILEQFFKVRYLFKLEADYAATLILPPPNNMRPFDYFMQQLDFENFYKWALNRATFKQMKPEEIDDIGSAFDMKQYYAHVSDNTKARTDVLSDLNRVRLGLFNIGACMQLVLQYGG